MKTIFSISLCLLLSLGRLPGQAKSFDEIGKTLCKSLTKNSSQLFETLLMPKATYLRWIEKIAPPELTPEEKEEGIERMRTSYELSLIHI